MLFLLYALSVLLCWFDHQKASPWRSTGGNSRFRSLLLGFYRRIPDKDRDFFAKAGINP